MSEQDIRDLKAQLTMLQAQMNELGDGRNLPAPFPQSIQSPSNTPPVSLDDPLDVLDRRIATEPVHIGRELLYVRQELSKQKETSRDREHVRSLERKNFNAKVALSFAALAAGVGLAAAGFGLPGFVCLGAGLYTIAPSFIDRVTERVFGGKK
jgi:hypothetical protein